MGLGVSAPLGGPVGGIDDSQGEQPAARPPLNDSMENDPLINAGKAVLSGFKGLWGAVTVASGTGSGGSGGSGPGQAPQRGEKDSKDNTFYFDKEKGRWRQRG